MDSDDEYDGIIIEEHDQPYEEDLIRNPHNIKSWLRYINVKTKAPPRVLYMLYERALKQLPGRRIHARKLSPGSILHEETNNAHERALVTMHKVGLLWNSLANYYVRCGNLERARDIYAEALNSVLTVRDFTQVFDAYAEYEEKVAKAKMDRLSKADTCTEDDDLELEFHIARLESLMNLRPLLLNSVLLRQNPHKVSDWLNRVELLESQGPREQIKAYMDGISAVDPEKASSGRPSSLWIGLAKLYEKHKQLSDAMAVLQKATGVNFVNVDDLAAIWCEWAEMYLRNKKPFEALRLLMKAIAVPSRKIDYFDRTETVQMRLHKSLKVWSMYTDLEESFGSFETTKAAYDQMIDLRIATPQIIMNFAIFLEDYKYFEEAFKAYEKGIALFKWPNVYDIWVEYLTKFMQRYGGSKLERARDLFEQCLEHCPPKFTKSLYLLYADLEEQYGLARRAIRIHERATEAVLPEERFEVFNIYIQRIATLHGLTHTRPAYEQAIERLPESHARQMCLRFADLEAKLGEIDRARAVYAYCAQMCDPRTQPEFWQTWKEFEVKYGNEDTLREMLRIRRSVQATYNTRVSFIASQHQQQRAGQSTTNAAAPDEMQKLDQQQQAESTTTGDNAQEPPPSKRPFGLGRTVAFQSAGVRQLGLTDEGSAKNSTSATNKEVIDIDDDDDPDDDGDDDQKGTDEADIVHLEQQPVPASVFGRLADDD